MASNELDVDCEEVPQEEYTAADFTDVHYITELRRRRISEMAKVFRAPRRRRPERPEERPERSSTRGRAMAMVAATETPRSVSSASMTPEMEEARRRRKEKRREKREKEREMVKGYRKQESQKAPSGLDNGLRVATGNTSRREHEMKAKGGGDSDHEMIMDDNPSVYESGFRTPERPSTSNSDIFDSMQISPMLQPTSPPSSISTHLQFDRYPPHPPYSFSFFERMRDSPPRLPDAG